MKEIELGLGGLEPEEAPGGAEVGKAAVGHGITREVASRRPQAHYWTEVTAYARQFAAMPFRLREPPSSEAMNGAGDEVPYGARHEHLASRRQDWSSSRIRRATMQAE